MQLSKEEELALKEGREITAMSEMKGWQEYLEPWLKAKRDQSFPDPSQFDSEEKFAYAAKTASVFKKVVAEILLYVENQKSIFNELTEKKKSQQKDKFEIGG